MPLILKPKRPKAHLLSSSSPSQLLLYRKTNHRSIVTRQRHARVSSPIRKWSNRLTVEASNVTVLLYCIIWLNALKYNLWCGYNEFLFNSKCNLIGLVCVIVCQILISHCEGCSFAYYYTYESEINVVLVLARVCNDLVVAASCFEFAASNYI